MAWLKNVLIDVLVTIVIGIYAFQTAEWGYWIITIYTPLMLLLKVAAVASGVTKKVKKDPNAAPDWFYHVLYAVNLLLLLYTGWWIMAGGWAAIWLLSAIQAAKSSNKK